MTSLCHPATRYGPRAPESALGLVWHGSRQNARIRALAGAVADDPARLGR
ncbi:hypothetical protein G3I34_21300 [Streptomyces sp. SID8014]|nr:hypothetical protein [Streptomyces sp. SID8014]NEC14753.1 hypothetical protein [Streptomyces sp. SID8014]